MNRSFTSSKIKNNFTVKLKYHFNFTVIRDYITKSTLLILDSKSSQSLSTKSWVSLKK